jgi:hypothetical protein
VRYQYPRLVIPASVLDFALLAPDDEVLVKVYRGKLVIELLTLAPVPPQEPAPSTPSTPQEG